MQTASLSSNVYQMQHELTQPENYVQKLLSLEKTICNTHSTDIKLTMNYFKRVYARQLLIPRERESPIFIQQILNQI